MTNQPLHILIADDHAIVRDGLEAILSAQPEIARRMIREISQPPKLPPRPKF
jgi:DNA-binding NarL/FixJ family response regulator